MSRLNRQSASYAVAALALATEQPISEIMAAPAGVMNAMNAILGDRERKMEQRRRGVR